MISPERVLRDLSELWTATAREAPEGEQAGVLRACSMTLIVLTGEPAGGPLEETIAALMPEHPARTILVRLDPGAAEMAQRVYAQCWMPFGHRRQICCEHIEITAPEGAMADLGPVLVPLTAPDLPVVLWLRRATLLGAPDFGDLAGIADKIVLDSAALPQAPEALKRLAAMAAGATPVGDLSWTRLTRWREMLAHVFDNPAHLANLGGLTSLRVEAAGEPGPSAWYMAAWLGDSLAQAGVTVKPAVGGVAEVSGAMTISMEGEGLRLTMQPTDKRLVVELNGLTQCANLPEGSDYALMREELAVTGRDRVFERTLASAAGLAVSSPA